MPSEKAPDMRSQVEIENGHKIDDLIGAGRNHLVAISTALRAASGKMDQIAFNNLIIELRVSLRETMEKAVNETKS